MPAPATIEEYRDLVLKSGVLDERRLDDYLQKLRAGQSLPAQPAALAQRMVGDGLLTRFQVDHFLQGKYLGFSIGNYTILEMIGSGGMSQVFLCEHKVHRCRVALKVMSRVEDATLLKRFYREARATFALDHPNIVRGYEIDQDKRNHYLVMEYVDGASLHQIVASRGPLSLLRAAHYMRQAAIGLQHAHEAKLVHRDIKPGNLLVNRAGVITILDLGLARFFQEEEDTLTHGVLGTVEYLAPEQSRDSHDVDIRADIFSLGATFYFILTGVPPFGEGTAEQKIAGLRNQEPKPIRQRRPEVSVELAAIVDRMMAKAPMQRYQTPAEVVAALEPWTRDPIAPPPETEMPRLSPAAAVAGVPNANEVLKDTLHVGPLSTFSSASRRTGGKTLKPPPNASPKAVPENQRPREYDPTLLIDDDSAPRRPIPATQRVSVDWTPLTEPRRKVWLWWLIVAGTALIAVGAGVFFYQR
jgi:eukaryotic-like serine/threonine-protein kinase